MIYRRYSISIAPRHPYTLPENLLREFGCSVTEPSNWKEGMTLERGLTFLDKGGHELTSEIFVHLPIFSKTSKTPEKKEIQTLVCQQIQDALGIDPSHLHVQVAEYQ